jgi:hypothetical protein
VDWTPFSTGQLLTMVTRDCVSTLMQQGSRTFLKLSHSATDTVFFGSPQQRRSSGLWSRLEFKPSSSLASPSHIATSTHIDNEQQQDS